MRPGRPVLAQAAGIALHATTRTAVIAALGLSQQPFGIDREAIDRQIRDLALAHAAGRLGDDAYLSRLNALRDARDAVAERTADRVPAQRAVERLRTLGESLKEADVPEEKSDLLHAIYERIVVAGPNIVRVDLTSAAYAHGWRWRCPRRL